ncbi:MAG: hypothetical protein E6921_21790 [Klebsiella michiganensis]|nr:hypothetical protein [Klebsiella michiganensis]
MPLLVFQFLNLQLNLMLGQQRRHDPADHAMLDMVLVVGQPDRFQARRFFAGVAARVMPAGQQTIGREPVSLIMLAGVVEQAGGLEQIA